MRHTRFIDVHFLQKQAWQWPSLFSHSFLISSAIWVRWRVSFLPRKGTQRALENIARFSLN